MKRILPQRIVITVIVMVVAITSALCQAPSITSPSSQPSENRPLYPVTLDRRVVLQISWGYKNFSAPLRAAAIQQRLDEVANDVSLLEVATTNPTDLTIDVLVGDRLVVSVFDGDARQAGISKEVLAQQWQNAITQAIVRYRHEHTRQKLILRIVLTVLILVGTIALLLLLSPLARWAKKTATTRSMHRLQSSKRRGLSLIDTAQLSELIHLSIKAIRLLLSVFILYVAFHFLLSIFPQTSGVANEMMSAVMNPVKGFGRAAWKSAPSLVFIAIIAIVCRYLLHFVAFAFTRIKQGSVTIEGFRPAWAPTTQRLVSIFVVLLAALVAYPYIPGSDSQAFKGFSLFIGVLVSLGSTGIVSNMFTGIMLTYMDSFQLGDYIQIGETYGYVQSTSLFVTRLQTRQNRIITIPNSVVLSSQITNYSATGDGSTTLSTTAGIGYDTPWRQVEAMLIQAGRKTAGVRETPVPFVLELSLNSFDVTYELTVFLEPGNPANTVLAALNRNILDEFNLYGVQIMTPAYMSDPPQPAVVAPENWYAKPATNPGRSGPDDHLGDGRAANGKDAPTPGSEDR